MAELKEFAGELKELPHITRHIGLAEELSRRCAQQRFRDRIAAEQSLLDGVALDATCESIEVGTAKGSTKDHIPVHREEGLLSEAVLFCAWRKTLFDSELLKLMFDCGRPCACDCGVNAVLKLLHM